MECSICYEKFQEVAITQCNHTFCKTCIYNWKSINDTCPCCRQILIIQTIKKIPCLPLQNSIPTIPTIPTFQYIKTISGIEPTSIFNLQKKISTKIIVLIWNITSITPASTYINSEKLKTNQIAVIYLIRNRLSDFEIIQLKETHKCSNLIYYNR